MKKLISLMCVLVLLLCLVPAASAEDGNVRYNGDVGEFIFQPGGQESLTDLFPDFKDVMPGDVLTQGITVVNERSRDVKVKLYIRSLGAKEGFEEFLSQMNLKVRVSDDNTMGYMFDAAASETAQLSDWVCLGTLYSGGKVNLEVELSVPVTMGNEFADQVGFLDWEFRAEEFLVSPDDPQPPTGDSTDLTLLTTIAIASGVALAALIVLVILKKKKKDKE